MKTYPTIAQQFPIRLPNGASIARFAKHCPSCTHLVESVHMYGEVRLLNQIVVLAAQGECPQCQQQFPIVCSIDSNKKIQRLWIPMLAMRWYMHQYVPRAVAVSKPIISKVTPPAHQSIEPSEDILGKVGELCIPSYLMIDGQEYAFDHIAQVGESLSSSDFLWQKKLIYKKTKQP